VDHDDHDDPDGADHDDHDAHDDDETVGWGLRVIINSFGFHSFKILHGGTIVFNFFSRNCSVVATESFWLLTCFN
jgi:hypothetical protein